MSIENLPGWTVLLFLAGCVFRSSCRTLVVINNTGDSNKGNYPIFATGHCRFLFAKEQKACPITRSSVARKVTRNAPIIFWYAESKFTEQEYIKK